jgi:hypothetical protein
METNFLDALAVIIAQHAFHGDPMPAIGAVPAKDVPSPWASVVVNSRSMTANLEDCYGDRILLTLLGDDIHVPDKTLGRAVILRTARKAEPVALAGLRIHLERFPPKVRVRFVEAVSPFGGILREEGIGFSSQPVSFLKSRTSKLLAQALCSQPGSTLYGRFSLILGDQGMLYAEVIELLPRPRCLEALGAQGEWG